MKSKILIDLVKLLGGFLLLWAAFAFLPKYLPQDWVPDWVKGEADVSLSYEQEEKLGEFMLDIMLQEEFEVNDTIVDSALWVIENRLLAHIGQTDYNYTFHIVDNAQVNALTLPGGHIIVYTGLIEMSETPEEVAAVLAHELGHAQLRHVTEKLVTELGLTFVLTVLTGGDATLINELTHTLISGVFSRNQEAEADAYALALLEDASIEPKSMAAFFRKMNREELSYDERLEWLMSHPHNNSRIKASLAYETRPDFESEPLKLNWERVISRLKDVEL